MSDSNKKNLGFDLNPDKFSLPMAEVISEEDWAIARKIGGEEFVQQLMTSPITFNDLLSLTPDELRRFGMEGMFDTPLSEVMPDYLKDILKEMHGNERVDKILQTNISMREMAPLLQEDLQEATVDGKIVWIYVPKELKDE